MSKRVLAVLLCASILLLLSCPLPLDRAMVIHVKDAIVPSIEIPSPTDYSSYAAAVLVAGKVVDAATETGEAGSIASLAYVIEPATLPGGVITPEADGSFSFSFTTSGLSGPMVIRILAEDWNGNVAEASITLLNEGPSPRSSRSRATVWSGSPGTTCPSRRATRSTTCATA